MGDTNLPEQPTYTLAQRLAIFAVLDARNKAEGLALKNARPGLLAEQVAEFKESGSKSRVLKADGQRLGTATVNEPSDKISVSSPKAYLAWVEEHYPDEVDYVAVVKPAFESKHVDIKRLERIEDPEAPGEFIVIDKKLGVPVDGVKITPAGDPQSFTIKMSPDEKALALAIANGVDLAALAAPKQIEADTVVEGDLTFVADSTGNVQAPGTAEDIVDAEVVDDAAA